MEEDLSSSSVLTSLLFNLHFPHNSAELIDAFSHDASSLALL